MNVVYANVLLYAVNSAADRHVESRRWFDDQLSGASTVGFSWVVLLAFLRLSTRVGLIPAPLPVDAALGTVRSWLDQPTSVVVEPTVQTPRRAAGPADRSWDRRQPHQRRARRGAGRAVPRTVITYDNDFAHVR